MASSDEESSMDQQPQNKLALQFASLSGRHLQYLTTTYEGDDTYSVTSDYGGEPFAVQFLSRAAAAEFLHYAMKFEHDLAIISRTGNFSLGPLADRSHEALMRYLLLLRDSRGLVCG
jgi:hypothetical protein